MDFSEDLEKAEKAAANREVALIDLAKQPVNVVKASVSNNLVHKLQNDENAKQRVDEATDKLLDSGLEVVENEVESAKNTSETEKLKTYFNQHKEELKTAGIDEPTYMEDMERGVKCHRKWADVHWKVFGWWQTGIRTFIQKAKPFKLWLNGMAITLCVGLTALTVWGVVALIRLIVG